MNALRTSVLAAAVLSVSSVAMAQVGPQLLIGPFKGDSTFDGAAAVTHFLEADTDFDADISGEDLDTSLTRYFAQGRYRLMPEHRADPRVGFSINYLQVDSDVDILPDSFTEVQLGAGTGIAEYEGWVAGLTFGIGWAGASEFGDSDAYFSTATLLIGRQLDENTSLGIALDYNGNRTFMPDTPLPGIVWTRKMPDEKLEVSLGFPFAYGRWRPTDELLLEINFTFPDFVGARATYEFVDGAGLFASFAQRTDAWHSEDFGNDIDRVLFEQTMVEVGVRFDVHERFVLNLAGGYAFGQEFRSGFDSRDTDEIVEIDDGPFIRLEGQFSF